MKKNKDQRFLKPYVLYMVNIKLIFAFLLLNKI